MIAALFGLGVLFSSGNEEDEPPDAASALVARVATKLERVRRLRFDELPPVRSVTAAEARDEGLELLDAEYPPERRAADETVLRLLGLLPADADLRELFGTIFGEEVAGYYDQRSKQMTLVGEGEPDEIVLAHELTHALEDQRFGLDTAEDQLDDESTARAALHEGTATVAMMDYSGAGRSALGALDLAELLSTGSGLPPYVQRALVFPYVAGARFVDAIGTWRPVNRALDGHPPVSTEQVLHPAKYRSGEKPLPVHVSSPGRRWSSVVSGTIGEFDTAELVRSSDSAVRADRAGAGWGGGRYVLWRRGSDRALSVAWRWDTRLDAAEFVAALPRYISRTLGGRSVRAGVWRTDDGNEVTVQVGEVVRLLIAPG